MQRIASQVTPKIQLTITEPSMTLLHRVGMAGLWMTLKRLEQEHYQQYMECCCLWWER
jgi:hypothetical protein